MSAEDQKKAQVENARAKNLDKDLSHQNREELLVNKLLLLGAGESGKSTLFRQMVTLYGKGYKDERDKNVFVPIVYGNCIMAMKCIIDACPQWGKPIQATAECATIKELKEDVYPYPEIDEKIGNQLKTLWADPGIQACYLNRSKYWLIDSAKYYFSNLDRIMQPDYSPSQQDILRARIRTTGIVETTFEIEQNQFRMFDVGGQRNERRKWIHCFENVTAVLFVGVLSEYDLNLYEDETQNRMIETLQLFEETINSQWFKKTSVILFLNKRDLFEEKILEVPLTVCEAFADYDGEPHNIEQAQSFIEGEFFAMRSEDNKDKDIYSHITCATDTGNVEAVFNDVKDIIIKNSLQGAGLV